MQDLSNNTQYLNDIEYINEIILNNYKKFFEVLDHLEVKLNSHISPIENDVKFEYLLIQKRKAIFSHYDKLTSELSYIKRLVEEFNFLDINDSIKDSFSNQLNIVLSNLPTIESQINSFTEIADKIGYKHLEADGTHSEASQPTKYTQELVNKLIPMCETLEHFTSETFLFLKNATLLISNNINRDLSKTEIEVYERLNDEIALLLKKYTNKISNITQIYENKIKNYELDLDKLRKSSELLITGVDAGLKKINELNQTSEKLDLDLSTFIKDKRIIIEEELGVERDKISESIKNVKSALLEEEKNIKDAHKGFIALVSDAGIYKLTDNYKKKAEAENEEYKTFRRYTNRAIYWAIGTAIVMFLISWAEIVFTEKDTNLLFFIYRMSISLMFFVLAFYSSKQASKHYECFQENNRTYLQLAALEPFMERMSEEEKKEIRKNLVPTYFSPASEGKYSSKGDEITLPTDIKGIAEKLIDVGKSLLDKAKDDPKP